jgi:hypothetical protein
MKTTTYEDRLLWADTPTVIIITTCTCNQRVKRTMRTPCCYVTQQHNDLFIYLREVDGLCVRARANVSVPPITLSYP